MDQASRFSIFCILETGSRPNSNSQAGRRWGQMFVNYFTIIISLVNNFIDPPRFALYTETRHDHKFRV